MSLPAKSNFPEELIARATRVSDESAEIAIRLAKRADVISAFKAAMDLISIFFGLAALIVSISQIVEAELGRWSNWVIAVSAIILVGSVALERRAFRDPPERFRDYAYYLAMFSERIRDILADHKAPAERLEEVCTVAATNVADVRSKWPSLAPLRSGPPKQ